MIFYFYFNPQHTHHSWLTHSGNKGPRRDAPRSFVAVDERFFLSLVRGSLSKADASAMPNTWCFMQCKSQGSQMISPSLPDPAAVIRLHPPLHCGFQYYSFNGLNDFSAPETWIKYTNYSGRYSEKAVILFDSSDFSHWESGVPQPEAGEADPMWRGDPSQQAVHLVIHRCFTSFKNTFHSSWWLTVETGPKPLLLIS